MTGFWIRLYVLVVTENSNHSKITSMNCLNNNQTDWLLAKILKIHSSGAMEYRTHSKGILSTISNIYDGTFSKNYFQPLFIFTKNSIINRVLNTSQEECKNLFNIHSLLSFKRAGTVFLDRLIYGITIEEPMVTGCWLYQKCNFLKIDTAYRYIYRIHTSS